MAFVEFAHTPWEASAQTVVLTDIKSVTRFFQTKAIPPSFWNACDYMLQFIFKIAQTAGSVKTAADFLSRLELKIREKTRLKIREDVQITPIEVKTSSSDVAEEEQVFFTQVCGENETEEQILERKEQSRKKTAEWVAHEKPSSMKPKIKNSQRLTETPRRTPYTESTRILRRDW